METAEQLEQGELLPEKLKYFDEFQDEVYQEKRTESISEEDMSEPDALDMDEDSLVDEVVENVGIHI